MNANLVVSICCDVFILFKCLVLLMAYLGIWRMDHNMFPHIICVAWVESQQPATEIVSIWINLFQFTGCSFINASRPWRKFAKKRPWRKFAKKRPWCTLYCQLITLWVVVIPSHCVYVSHSHNVIDLYISLVVWFVFTTCNLLHSYKKTGHP